MVIGKTVIIKAYFSTSILIGFSLFCFLYFWLTNNNNILWIFIVSLIFSAITLIFQSILFEVRVNSGGFIVRNALKKNVKKSLDDFLAVKDIIPFFGLGKIYFKDNTSYLFPIEDRFFVRSLLSWDLKKIENEITTSIEDKIFTLKGITQKSVQC